MARLVFDVDGVIANPYDQDGKELDYWDRAPYPFVKDFLTELAKSHTIVIQTARYMGRTNGNVIASYSLGLVELIAWLKKWELTFDEVFFGKPSGAIYVDDKGFRVRSENGKEDWFTLLRELGKPEYKDLQEENPAGPYRTEQG